jgi:hypothetical protein
VLPSDDSSASSDEPRHPFTYRAPAEGGLDKPAASFDEIADEARRNDAMLLWASGLVAVVFACTTIADSQVLVHVKTGQYLASHGVLPPWTDVFSASAADRPWINLSWLFDLGVAGLHAIGGATVLTILQCLAAIGLVLLVLRSRHRGVTSWWAAFVIALMAVAAMPHLEASPYLVTLLGIAATLWLIVRSHGGDVRTIWILVPLFLVWSNLDPRMFLGLAALLLYGLGDLAGWLLGRPSFGNRAERMRYWIVVGASIVASFVNPFLWKAPLGAMDLYGRVDPAFREYYANDAAWLKLAHTPLFQHPTAALLDTALLAGMLLAGVSLATLALNRRRINYSEVALWLGFVGFGIAAGREWPTASVVFAILAIRNAEDWFRNSFRQTYGTDRGELIFARGGRAVTVLAFAALAVLWLTGRIIADDGRRPGVGLDPLITGQIESMKSILSDSFDHKVFNFHAAQGDLLIWLGFQPYIDHRLEIFVGDRSGEGEDLIRQHDDVRHALLLASADDPRAGRPEVWKPALEAAGIVQAMPRLTFPSPSYLSYFDLLRSRDWRLVDIGAAGALFCRIDTGNPKVAEFLQDHSLNLSARAFRKPAIELKNDAVWPRERTWSDTLTRRVRVPNDLARALHLLQHLEVTQGGVLNMPLEASIPIAYLALRDCYATLADDPQNLVAYQCLGRIYESLYMLESQASGVALRRRLYQSLDAYGQALTIAPEESATYQRLVPLYLGFNKMDLAIHARDEYERLAGQDFPRPPAIETLDAWETMWTQLEAEVDRITTQATDAIEKGQPRLDVVLFAWQNGCTRLALDLIDADPAFASESGEVRRLRALLLLESAKPQQAFERLADLEAQAPPEFLGELRDPLAYATLALPDFDRAKALWEDQANESAEGQMVAAMQAVPFVGGLNGPTLFPIVQTTMSAQSMTALPQKVAENKMNAILCDLEAGRIETAEKDLAALLAHHPFTPFTPLAGFYLQQIRGEPVQITIPPRGVDRYAAVEVGLDDADVERQIEEAGPVEAAKPATARSEKPNAEGRNP